MKFQQLHHINPSENIMFTKSDSPVHMYIYLANILDPNGLQGGRREKNILYIYHTQNLQTNINIIFPTTDKLS